MNQYGTTAQRHWARWLPERYAAIEDPDSFFSSLGEEAATQIANPTWTWRATTRRGRTT